MRYRGRVDKAIEAERKNLHRFEKKPITFGYQSYVGTELKQEIDKIFLEKTVYENFFVRSCLLDLNMEYRKIRIWYLMSFSSNPYYVPELKPLTGND